MIIFGTRGRMVPGPRKQGVPCDACGKEDHATYGILRYFHVFFIPVFPTSRQPAMECLHCKKALVGKEIPERTRADIARAVFTRGQVVPMFSGLIAGAVLFALVGVVGRQESERQAAYLRSPAAGDCYAVKLASFVKNADSKHPYGVMQVSSVAGGQVELRVGNFGYASGSGALKAIRKGETARADFFGAARATVPIEDLPRLESSGVIYAAKRP